MKRATLALFCAGIFAGMVSLSACAAERTSVQPSVARQAPQTQASQTQAPQKQAPQTTAQNLSAVNSTSTTANQVGKTGKAAGIDTAMAASAGGITATVLAVGVAALVVGVAVSDTGGGDDPAPPVTVQAE
ncbi:hypothetical protein VV869_05030 [Photobacterium sp. MCCC 1A19761]|uniref:hypothetical protein n=1 Tax=Photobacterium sp. MCCC 1A19761 TaxID=3115000 RepID=UPI00307D6984